MTITTKFSVGDKVYTTMGGQIPTYGKCLDCKGSGVIFTALGKEIRCPYCYSKGQVIKKWSYTYTPVGPYHVASVRFNTHEDDPASYMLTETGCPSGSVYSEGQLFSTEEDAKKACKKLIKEKHDE